MADIKKISEKFDYALVKGDYGEILDFFHPDCEIELLLKLACISL